MTNGTSEGQPDEPPYLRVPVHLRFPRHWQSWLAPTALGLALGLLSHRCSVRAAADCRPPCPRTQMCYRGACIDVAAARCLAAQDMLPAVEVLFGPAK